MRVVNQFVPLSNLYPFLIYKIQTNIKKSESKKAAIAILNMCDVGVIHVIEGTDIDRPRNALTLTLEMHKPFGNFDIFFNVKPMISHIPITSTHLILFLRRNSNFLSVDHCSYTQLSTLRRSDFSNFTLRLATFFTFLAPGNTSIVSLGIWRMGQCGRTGRHSLALW